MKKIVETPDQVVANILKFQTELAANSVLQARLGRAPAWYACRLSGGDWIFGPSKFVGYADNNAKSYIKNNKDKADGRKTEKALQRMFSPVDPDSRLGRELHDALRKFLRQWDRCPKAQSRISVVIDEVRHANADASFVDESSLSKRIISDPEICGGRPCIKGTRMRISDIVDMFAHGATTGEILADYPYLSHEDIVAALAYAARATDHRVIRAA